jgi:type IX secretion system PorP/SprF family membrane protein
MKKLFTRIAIAVAGFTGVAVAQQDPQFTQWMHNRIIYNPGYAGTSGGICGALQFRQQWVNFTGAPQSIALAGDMRLTNIPLGVGLTVLSDKIGPMNTNFVRAAGSWNLTNIGKGVLGIGMDVGMLQKSINANWIVPEPDKIDNTIPGTYGDNSINNPSLNKITYDLGFGAFYQIPGRFYAGLSSTHLPAQTVGSGDIKYEMTRHFYFMTGYTHAIDPRNDIGVNIKYKSDLAAGALDANLMYTWDKSISGGVTYRMGDAAAFLLGYQTKPFGGGYVGRIGYSYDFILSRIKGYSSGSHEILLGVCYTPKVKKVTSYGDPRFLN